MKNPGNPRNNQHAYLTQDTVSTVDQAEVVTPHLRLGEIHHSNTRLCEILYTYRKRKPASVQCPHSSSTNQQSVLERVKSTWIRFQDVDQCACISREKQAS